MIGLQELIDYCRAKPEAEIAFPFGDVPVCFKFRGRIFAELYPNADDYKLTVRCDPEAGEYYRAAYPAAVVPGYHVPLRQRRFKNTIHLGAGIDEAAVYAMIDHSYATLAGGDQAAAKG